MIAVGIGPVGMVMLGAAAEEWGAATATAMMGVISTALLLVILLANASVRRVDQEAASVSAAAMEAQEAVAAEATPSPGRASAS